jgi:hypothetical protein
MALCNIAQTLHGVFANQWQCSATRKQQYATGWLPSGVVDCIFLFICTAALLLSICTAAVLLAGRKSRGFEPVDLVVVGLVGGSDANPTLSVLNCCSAYDVHRSQGARL